MPWWVPLSHSARFSLTPALLCSPSASPLLKMSGCLLNSFAAFALTALFGSAFHMAPTHTPQWSQDARLISQTMHRWGFWAPTPNRLHMHGPQPEASTHSAPLVSVSPSNIVSSPSLLSLVGEGLSHTRTMQQYHAWAWLVRWLSQRVTPHNRSGSLTGLTGNKLPQCLYFSRSGSGLGGPRLALSGPSAAAPLMCCSTGCCSPCCSAPLALGL